jgi:hypothetical protein
MKEVKGVMTVQQLPVGVLRALAMPIFARPSLSQTPKPSRTSQTSSAIEKVDSMRPPFKQLRYEEDWSFLRDPQQHVKPLLPLTMWSSEGDVLLLFALD